MKFISSILLISLFFPTISFATKTPVNIEIMDTNKVYSNRDMNYFLNKGYKLVLQETRGIRKAYVLKKGNDYIGCRTESLSKKEICYVIELKRAD